MTCIRLLTFIWKVFSSFKLVCFHLIFFLAVDSSRTLYWWVFSWMSTTIHSYIVVVDIHCLQYSHLVFNNPNSQDSLFSSLLFGYCKKKQLYEFSDMSFSLLVYACPIISSLFYLNFLLYHGVTVKVNEIEI
jgi:hypothetical protein